MNEIIKYLTTKGGIGINQHEIDSYNLGYLKEHLDNYLVLKNVIFKKLENTKDISLVRYLHAIRIYSYSIFENLWYGYIISYSDFKTTEYCINGQKLKLGDNNLFKNHLPSFSSAILNFGTCRDYYFVLLRISANQDFSISLDNLKKTVKINYPFKDSKDFEPDIRKLTNDTDYIESAKRIKDINEFRNFYAHRLRIIWWTNQNYSDFCFKKDLIDSIDAKDDDRWSKHLLDIFSNAEQYEQEISNSKTENIVSSSKILQDNHTELAAFMNKTYKYIKDKIENEIK